MPNLFAKMATWLPEQMQAAAGVSVTYTRSTTTLSVTGWVGRNTYRSDALGGARVEIGDRDYFFLTSDLTLGNPSIGDRIAEVIDGTTYTFEVQTPDTGTKAWHWVGTTRSIVQVHTKRVS